MLDDRSVLLVTGSSSGIGLRLAAHYADRGSLVYGISRRDSDFQHEHYRHLVADITDEPSVREAMNRIYFEAGRLDVLINNAATKINSYALLTTGPQARTILLTNLFGAFLVSREAIKLMKRRRFGRVISFSSVAVRLGSAGSVLYGAGKAGLEQLMFGLSRELKADNITFNTLGISAFRESGMVASLSQKALGEAAAFLSKPEPLEIEEIVHGIDFFASRHAGNLTGQTLYFGGTR